MLPTVLPTDGLKLMLLAGNCIKGLLHCRHHFMICMSYMTTDADNQVSTCCLSCIGSKLIPQHALASYCLFVAGGASPCSDTVALCVTQKKLSAED